VDKLSLLAKRRPYERPPARVARVALERKLMRRSMRQVLTRLPPEMIAALDDERRKYPNIPARNAIVRELIGEALSFRRAGRPKTSGPGRGEPYPGRQAASGVAGRLQRRHPAAREGDRARPRPPQRGW
jgi:hypothetical protein